MRRQDERRRRRAVRAIDARAAEDILTGGASALVTIHLGSMGAAGFLIGAVSASDADPVLSLGDE